MRQEITELDRVALLRDLPEEELTRGHTGTIVYVHNRGEAFEVEFPLGGFRYTVATVRCEDLLKLKELAWSPKPSDPQSAGARHPVNERAT